MIQLEFFDLDKASVSLNMKSKRLLQEEEKMKLSEITGLGQKQINNWFINQRKRHWKPSEDMRFDLMEVVSGIMGGPMYFDNA